MRKVSGRTFAKLEVCLVHSLVPEATPYECVFWCSFTKKWIIFNTSFPVVLPSNDKVHLGEAVATNFRNIGEKIEQMGKGQARDELTVPLGQVEWDYFPHLLSNDSEAALFNNNLTGFAYLDPCSLGTLGSWVCPRHQRWSFRGVIQPSWSINFLKGSFLPQSYLWQSTTQAYFVLNHENSWRHAKESIW